MSDVMASLSGLSPAEKLDLIGKLWDDLSANSAGIPLTEEQQVELDERKEEFDANPSTGLTWPEVKQSILRRHAY